MRVIGLILLRIGIIAEPLWMRHWNSGFHKPLEFFNNTILYSDYQRIHTIACLKFSIYFPSPFFAVDQFRAINFLLSYSIYYFLHLRISRSSLSSSSSRLKSFQIFKIHLDSRVRRDGGRNPYSLVSVSNIPFFESQIPSRCIWFEDICIVDSESTVGWKVIPRASLFLRWVG